MALALSQDNLPDKLRPMAPWLVIAAAALLAPLVTPFMGWIAKYPAALVIPLGGWKELLRHLAGQHEADQREDRAKDHARDRGSQDER